MLLVGSIGAPCRAPLALQEEIPTISILRAADAWRAAPGHASTLAMLSKPS